HQARLIAGLGNIGETPGGPNNTAGVWLLLPDDHRQGGYRWVLEKGGHSTPGGLAIANSTLPGGNDNANPAFLGVNVGPVTVTLGQGRVGDESTVYVMVAEPPGPPERGEVNEGRVIATSPLYPNALEELPHVGNSAQGLYKSKDGFQNFTHVLLTQFVNLV